MAPLAGLRVVDVSRVLAGPFCSMVLADLGAEVIKVERPGTGDETRGWGPPFVGQFSAYFLSCNRNKKGLTLDLSQAEGRELLARLLQEADVYLDNFLPGSAARLGLTPDKLHQINPRLIVCSITGYGQTGPWQEVPGYDFAIQAMSGLMSITGPAEGPPCKVGVAVSDVLTGLYAAVGILACLQARQRSGHGYALDLALLECTLAAQVNVAQAYLATGQVPPRQGNAHLQIVPYQLLQTADGYLVLAVGNDSQWSRLCQALGRPDWSQDPRFARNADRVEHRTELVPLLQELFRQRTTAQWQELLSQAQVPHSPVLDYAQLFAHPQVQARGLRVRVHDPQGRPVDLLASPLRIAGEPLPAFAFPPALGQHTDEILTRLGLSPERIAQLRQRGVV
jgi:crotonobetainyl-CoA:carnitine CoA-transferase CaiB-like acyl-CoA transferase